MWRSVETSLSAVEEKGVGSRDYSTFLQDKAKSTKPEPQSRMTVATVVFYPASSHLHTPASLFGSLLHTTVGYADPHHREYPSHVVRLFTLMCIYMQRTIIFASHSLNNFKASRNYQTYTPYLTISIRVDISLSHNSSYDECHIAAQLHWPRTKYFSHGPGSFTFKRTLAVSEPTCQQRPISANTSLPACRLRQKTAARR